MEFAKNTHPLMKDKIKEDYYMNIIGYYKDWTLVEKDGDYLVINRPDKKILYKGSEDQASRYFIMLVADFIDENMRVKN